MNEENKKTTQSNNDMNRGERGRTTYVRRFIGESEEWLTDAKNAVCRVEDVLKEIKRHCDDLLICSGETITRVKARRILEVIDELYCKNINDSYSGSLSDDKENDVANS